MSNNNGKLDNFLQNKQQETQPQTATETQEINLSEQIVGLVESLYSDYKPIVAITGQLLAVKVATEINSECQKTLLGLTAEENRETINSKAVLDARKRLAIADNNLYSNRLLLAGKNG